MIFRSESVHSVNDVNGVNGFLDTLVYGRHIYTRGSFVYVSRVYSGEPPLTLLTLLTKTKKHSKINGFKRSRFLKNDVNKVITKEENMHALHKILVKVDKTAKNRDEKIQAARDEAESATNDFMNAFDWRETDTAGRWSEVYPENVILSEEYLDRVITELETARTFQLQQIDYCMSRIEKDGMSLEEIAKNNRDSVQNFGLLFEIKLLVELLSGCYVFDSGFFSVESFSAKVTDDLINHIKATPDDWALVMFDYHI